MASQPINYGEYLRQLDQGIIASSYFFSGPEDVLIEWALQRLKKAALKPGEADFNWDVFRADDDMNWTAFADSLNSLPLLGGRRVVVLKRAGKAQTVKGATALLERALKDSPPDLTLVLIEPDADLSKAFYQKIAQYATSVFFPLPQIHEVQRLLKDYLADYQKEISDDALVQILSESNPSLRDLLSKMDVLISYIGEKPSIEPADVEASTIFTREVEIFKLLEAIGRRDRPLAHQVLRLLLLRPTEVGNLIYLIYRQTWALYRMKYLQEKKVPVAQWSQQLKLKPAFLEKRYRDYLQHYSRKELGFSLEIIAQVDRERKSSAIEETHLFWAMLEALLQPTSSRM